MSGSCETSRAFPLFPALGEKTESLLENFHILLCLLKGSLELSIFSDEICLAPAGQLLLFPRFLLLFTPASSHTACLH